MAAEKQEIPEDENRIEIVYKPAKQIVILDYCQFSKNSLTQMFAKMIHSGLPVIAQWADGVLFIHSLLPPDTNDLMERYLEGMIFWSSVNFALMPE